MAYQSKVQILSPENGYNKAFKEYKKLHKYIKDFDKNLWQRFIPKDLEWFNILDLWWWDGRTSNFFQWKWVAEYQIIDISENMMSGCKNWIKTTKHNLNYGIPVEDNYSDITLCFFTLLYIADPNALFQEVYRTMAENGIFLLFHHIERKAYEYKIWKERFKIENYVYNYKQIEKNLEYNFFKFKVLEIIDKWNLIWKLYACTK